MHSGAQTPMHAWGSQTPSHPGSMTPSRAPMTPGRECAFISHLLLRKRLLTAHRRLAPGAALAAVRHKHCNGSPGHDREFYAEVVWS